MIIVDVVGAADLREALKMYRRDKIISIVVSRYQDGWAHSYQIIYEV